MTQKWDNYCTFFYITLYKLPLMIWLWHGIL